MQCPKCNHEDSDANFGIPAKCPECGAYREKVIAQMERETTKKAVEAPRSEIKQRLDNARAAVSEKRAERAKGGMYCTDCGTQCNGKRKAKGSTLVELVLWLCFIIPGLIYSVWRVSNKYIACSACGSPSLIPIDSPKARRELGKS